jgi:predicted outer membrane repeat protein
MVRIKSLVPVNDMLLIFYIVYSGNTAGGEGGAFETNGTLSKQCL